MTTTMTRCRNAQTGTASTTASTHGKVLPHTPVGFASFGAVALPAANPATNAEEEEGRGLQR